MLHLCMRAFQLLQRERGERQRQTGREGGGEEFWALREALAKADRLHYPLGKIQL